ncbi:MAG: hypothetical protein E7279_01400 [Lachnospiraceae bacterium]|nr:hypothetical protein [Lachnospiraceae bacterium]
MNGMNDKHLDVMETVYEKNNASFVDALVYCFQNGKKKTLPPQTLDQEKELVKKYGTILSILPIQLTDLEKKNLDKRSI